MIDLLVILDNANTLEIRRLKIDLMLFKITHNLVELDFCSFFGLTNYTSTRGQNYKLIKHPTCAAALCSVKDGFSGKGKTIIFDCSPDPSPVTNQHQTIGKITYLDEFYECAIFHCNQLHTHTIAARTTHPILTHDSSKDAVWAEEVPFWDIMMTIYLLGVSSPKNRHYFGVSREITDCSIKIICMKSQIAQ